MVKGETKTGFKFTIDERIKTDWDFLEVVDALQNGDTKLSTVKKAIVMILTEKGFDNLKAHVRAKNDGLVPIDALMHEFYEICQSDDVVKK